MNKIVKFISAIALCWVAAGIGSLTTFSQIPTWYETLTKPGWNPPNWLFGPVWSVLYTLMGITLYLLWTSKSKYKNSAIKYFFAQLILNALWSWIFFGWHKLDIALAEIILLWLAILATIGYSYKTNKIAGALLIPYILWVSFASYLNYTVWVLNK